MTHSIESGEEITRPPAIGAEPERANPVRTDFNLVREDKDLERALVPETFQKKIKRPPGVEKGITTGNDDGN